MNSRRIAPVFLGLIPLFVLPTGTGLIASTFLYASLAWHSWIFSEFSAVSALCLLVYGSLSVLYNVFDLHGVAPLCGIALYLVLSLYSVVRSFQLKGSQRKLNLLNALTFTLALALSFYLRPSPAYVYVPLACVGIVFLFQQKLQQSLKRKHLFYSHNGFDVYEVLEPEEESERNRIISSAYNEIFLKSGLRGKGAEGREEFFRRCFVPSSSPSRNFLIRSQGRSIACFSLYLDQKKKGLPIEEELCLSLDWMRSNLGKIAEVGRLAIVQDYQNNGLLWECLFRAYAHACVRLRVTFVVCQAVESAYPLYRKIGFLPFLNGNGMLYDKEFETKCVPCYLNLSRRIALTLSRSVSKADPKRLKVIQAYGKWTSTILVNGKSLPDLESLPSESVRFSQNEIAQ